MSFLFNIGDKVKSNEALTKARRGHGFSGVIRDRKIHTNKRGKTFNLYKLDTRNMWTEERGLELDNGTTATTAIQPMKAAPLTKSSGPFPVHIKPSTPKAVGHKYKIGDTLIFKGPFNKGIPVKVKVIGLETYLRYTVRELDSKGQSVGMGIDEMFLEYAEAPLAKPVKLEMPEFSFLTLNEALLYDYKSKVPQYEGEAKKRIDEGRCPHCGEMGRYHMSTAICSKHGPY